MSPSTFLILSFLICKWVQLFLLSRSLEGLTVGRYGAFSTKLITQKTARERNVSYTALVTIVVIIFLLLKGILTEKNTRKAS